MCGISGIVSKKINKAAAKQVIGLMNDWQKDRGPDDKGILQSGPVTFGHRRLAIIDLSAAGHQPMKYRGKGELWITFNGEIYNFLELKKDLKDKGYKFKTKTDTEVILALYAEYGEKSFSKLRGMFAFGLWDDRNKKLFLVKDRYGIKPLYYYSDREKIIFASTVKAMEKSGLILIKKNDEAKISFLLFGSVVLPTTTLKDVLAVPAGHYLERDFSGGQKLVKYYEPLEFFEQKLLDDQNPSRHIRHLLEDAVNFHLISDAPLGVFLSGGLDSSTLAALAMIQREKPVSTLSIDFEENDFSEKTYQDLAVKKIKSQHREIKVVAEDFFDSFSEIFEAMDQPTIDGVNTFFIAQAAKKAGLKTVLSGLGSDEIFCGYPAFQRAALFRKIQQLPKFSKFPLGFISALGDRYAKLHYLREDNYLNFYLGFRGLFSPKETAKILDIKLKEVNDFLDKLIIDYRLPNYLTAELHPIDLFSYLELKFYLQNQLLKDTDFMSMYHSVEVRVPFLDHPLVEYLSGVDPKLKLSKSVNKPLLVEAMHDLLPQEILTRKKMGFAFPFGKWLKEAPNDIITNHQSPTIKKLTKKFKAGRLHWSRFWALYIANSFL